MWISSKAVEKPFSVSRQCESSKAAVEEWEERKIEFDKIILDQFKLHNNELLFIVPLELMPILVNLSTFLILDFSFVDSFRVDEKCATSEREQLSRGERQRNDGNDNDELFAFHFSCCRWYMRDRLKDFSSSFFRLSELLSSFSLVNKFQVMRSQFFRIMQLISYQSQDLHELQILTTDDHSLHTRYNTLRVS